MKTYVTQKFHKNFIRILAVILIAGMHLWWQGGPAVVFSQSLEQISISLSLFDVKNEPINGKYQVRFRLYSKDRTVRDAFPSDADAGFRLWEEAQEIEVRNGVMRTTLGSKVVIPPDLFSGDKDYYLGIRIGEDSEIVPRKKITSVPSAFSANTARTLNGKTFGTNGGDIPALDAKGKIDIKILPTGTGTKQLLLGSDGRLHDQNTDTGTSSEVFNIGSGSSPSASNFDLTVSNATAPAALRYNGATQSWQFSNDGTIFSDITSGAGSVSGTGTMGSVAYWTGTGTIGSETYLAVSRGGTNSATLGSAGSIAYSTGSSYGFSSVGSAGQALISGGSGIPTWTTLGGGSITADSLDFTELKDLLTLDASTDISITGSNALSLTNTGTGNSFLVSDQASDTTPFVIDASGNVGVGTSGPTQKLDIAGSINVSAGSAYRYNGTPVITAQPSLNNYFFGNAGNLTMTGAENTFVGSQSGFSNTTGIQNAFFGSYAGYANTTGSYNSFFGDSAGQYTTTTSGNSFFGNEAGRYNTTGFDNSFFGNVAGNSNTTGFENTYVGSFAGLYNETGTANTIIGYTAAGYDGGGSYSYNTILGHYAAGYLSTGSANTIIGKSAGRLNTTGANNAFLGAYASQSNTTGSGNTALGYQAGYNSSVALSTNANSVFIGRDANTSVDGLTNAIAVGYQAQATQSNQVVLGNASITQTLLRGNVGLGDTTPASLLTVGNGDLFQVNSTGAIASAAGITSSGTITFSGLSSAGLVTNSAGGVLGTTTGTSGQLLVANASNIPTFVTLSGDASLSNTGVLSLGIGSVVGANIASNTIEEIDLEVTNAPTGGFILSYDSTTGGFTWIANSGGTGSSKYTDNGTYTFLTDTTDDLVLGGSAIDTGFFFDVSASTLAFEGATADAFETTLGVVDPSADRSINLPNASGTVITTGNLSSITATGTVTSGTWQGTTIAVANGGTGLTTLPTNGVLLGNGTSPLSSASGTAGQLLVANATNVPSFTALSGDGTLSSAGVLTLSASSVAGVEIADNTIEEVDFEATNAPTDGYLLSFSNATGGFTWVSSGAVGAGDITDVGSCTSGGCFIDGTNHTLTFDGSVIDAFEITLSVANPTADRTITLPDATGTVALLNAGQTFTSALWNGTVVGAQYGGTGINGAAAAAGTVLIGNGSGYTLATMTQGTGITITNGAGSITINSTLGTDISGAEIANNTIEEVDLEATNVPTNGYVLSYDSTTAGFTWISNTAGTGTSKWTDTGTLTYLTDIADDLAIGGTTGIASRFFFDVTTGNQIVFEGTGADDLNETTLLITNPTADRTITLPDATGTVALLNAGQTFTSALWNGTVIGAQYGGTGAATLTSKGVLYGNGTSAISATAAGTSGQVLLGVTAGNPGFATLSGDASITDAGVFTIASNAVLLTTDTVGNYVATITAGNGISGASAAEGGTPTLALSALTSDWSQSGAFDIILGNAFSEIKILESSGATFFGAFDVGDLSADQTYSFTTGGTVFTSGNDGSGSTLDADLLDGQDGSYYGNLANMTGVLAISKGGTNATTLGAAGTLPYSDGTSYAFQSAAGSTGQALVSGGTATPTWYAPTIGSVLFAGISGALEQDNTNLFWNDSSNRLGLGTTVPSTRLDVSGLTLATDADSTVGAANFTFSLTKNDALTKTYPGLRILPTINTGLSNTTTTLNVLGIDTVNTATTGVTTNLIKASYGGVEQFLLASNGNVTATGQVNGADGLTTKVNAGACDDTTFSTDTDGTICIDSTNGRIYYRYGGAWHYSAQTAGFQIPDYEAYSYDFDRKSFNEDKPLAQGDFLMPFVENPMQDGALHGLYAKFSDVKGTLFAEEHEKLATLSLKTDQNVTTLGSLQASIDAELLSVSEALSDIEKASSKTDDRTTALDTRVFALEEEQSRTRSSLATLEEEMTTLSDQSQALLEFFTTLDMQRLVATDKEGNVDLLGGSIKARLLTTGGIVIENQDIEAPTIGTAVLYPKAIDADQDGRDDFSGEAMDEAGERDGKSVRVMTKAMIPMMKGSQVFTSFTGNPGGFSWVEKYVNDEGDYVGFDIRVSEPITAPIKIDWWLVERR